jgi:putative hemolysin
VKIMDDLGDIIRKIAYGAIFGIALLATLSLSGCEAQPIRACTEEAMLCPDGISYVGRTGPNCEFAACPAVPAPTEPVACTMEALLCPGTNEGFVGRQGPYCLFAACPAPTDKCNVTPQGTGAYMPNPASAYCVNIGGESIIKTAADGSQYGVCKWNSIEFDEWDLFRKNCQ